MIVGVLAVQGSFAEHMQVLRGLAVDVRLVRSPEELRGVSALVIPGGESTTIGDFLDKQGLGDAIEAGLPIFGTCAGMILLAKKMVGKQKEGQSLLKKMDITVERNAYGRQTESFEADVKLAWDARPFPGVFIRAPRIAEYSEDVSVLARRGDAAVLVRQGRYLACAFHPELTDDDRIHRYFIEEVAKNDS
ncbi:glutamine amidotransferase subunit PdxT [archaeon BMS3Abin16]|nr:glutamine amidotransferase subunit PdxT [archaeon BMS3Abin16]GBE56459.1 glutamine amidotransferase subunit PdxT [archaeon BMS3Bbin16]